MIENRRVTSRTYTGRFKVTQGSVQGHTRVVSRTMKGHMLLLPWDLYSERKRAVRCWANLILKKTDHERIFHDEGTFSWGWARCDKCILGERLRERGRKWERERNCFWIADINDSEQHIYIDPRKIQHWFVGTESIHSSLENYIPGCVSENWAEHLSSRRIITQHTYTAMI